MLYSVLYVVVRFLLEVLIVRGRSQAKLRAEVLALRHQLAVLERQVGRPCWQPSDRLVLAAISCVLPRPDWRSLIPRPETLLRWHRDMVRRGWAAYRRRPPRRRPMPRSELHDLILKLARENEGWGYRRIVGELIKLGCRCSNMTVRKVLRRNGLETAPRRSQRSWREFVRQHADQILATDLFHSGHGLADPALHPLLHRSGQPPSALGRLHLQPEPEWVVQQARNLAWMLQGGSLKARFLLRDRDSKFTVGFDEVFKSEGVEVIRLPFRAPRAKAYASHYTSSGRSDGNHRRRVRSGVPLALLRGVVAGRLIQTGTLVVVDLSTEQAGVAPLLHRRHADAE